MVLLLIAAALLVGLSVYAVLDCARTHPAEIAVLPKPAWLAVTVLVPVLGPAAWLLLGRDRRVRAPDDDDRFLASLNRRKPG